MRSSVAEEHPGLEPDPVIEAYKKDVDAQSTWDEG